jgi:hypothetical protein
MDLQSIEIRNLEVQDYQELKKSMKSAIWIWMRTIGMPIHKKAHQNFSPKGRFVLP